MQVAPQPTRAQPAGTPPSTFLFLPIHMSNSPEQQSPTSSHTARRRQYSPPDIDLGCTTPTMPLSCRGAPCRRAAARRVCPVYRTTRDSLSTAFMTFFQNVLRPGFEGLSHREAPVIHTDWFRSDAPRTWRIRRTWSGELARNAIATLATALGSRCCTRVAHGSPTVATFFRPLASRGYSGRLASLLSSKRRRRKRGPTIIAAGRGVRWIVGSDSEPPGGGREGAGKIAQRH